MSEAPALCSLCRMPRIALWSRDGTSERLCLGCLSAFLDSAEQEVFLEQLRALRPEHVTRGHVPSTAELLHARHAGVSIVAGCRWCEAEHPWPGAPA